IWCPIAALDEQRLMAEPLRQLIRNYLAGDLTTWWASTLPAGADALGDTIITAAEQDRDCAALDEGKR
ncbi:MAG TPA: hypothetical protein VKT80_10315, partial [Chloroflexota bacterium]|nr:hypothetical protein [Chloroflexota bacterium]